MNNEPRPPEEPAPKEPERRFLIPPGPQGRRVVDGVLARLTDPDHAARVLAGVRDYGAGFAAWLTLDDVAPEEPTLTERYEAAYANAWEHRDDLITDTIEALGWREALATFRAEHGIPDGRLEWNYDAFADDLRRAYDFVYLDGLTHAFHR